MNAQNHIHAALKRGQKRASREVAARVRRLSYRVARTSPFSRCCGISMAELDAILQIMASDAR